MRRLLALLLFCALCCLQAPRRAQGEPARPVTFRLFNLTFISATRLLAQATGDRYEVEGAIRDLPVSLELKRVPHTEVRTAAQQQLETQFPGLLLEKRKDQWVFRLGDGAPPPVPRRMEPVEVGKVAVIFGSVPLRKVVAQMFAEAPGVPKPRPYKVTVEERVLDVPIDFMHTANYESDILKLVTRQVNASQGGVDFEQLGDRLTIGIFPGRRLRGELFPELIPPDPPNARRIICAFERFPFNQATQMVMRRVLISKKLPLLHLESADALPETPISFHVVTNEPAVLLDSFFAEACKQVQGLGFHRQEEKVTLSFRQASK